MLAPLALCGAGLVVARVQLTGVSGMTGTDSLKRALGAWDAAVLWPRRRSTCGMLGW